jgi:hypothetical protein
MDTCLGPVVGSQSSVLREIQGHNQDEQKRGYASVEMVIGKMADHTCTVYLPSLA